MPVYDYQALDSKGNIYATDIIGQRVQKFLIKN